MIVTSRRDRNSGDAKVAGTSRSPLLRLPMRSEFFRPSKNQELLAPAAPDCAWFKSIEQDLRRRARLEAECLAEFNQPAALSTYQRGKSVRTTRATALQGSETESEDQDLRRYLSQRRQDPGLDGADRHVVAALPAAEVKVGLVALQPRGAIAHEPVHAP